MRCDICCSFPLYDMLRQHQQRDTGGAFLTIMGTTIPSSSEEDCSKYGRFIYNEDTLGKCSVIPHINLFDL